MFRIPTFSQPLTKFIRTLEGLIVLGSNVALVLAPIVSSHVSPTQAIKYGAILNSVTVFSRSLLKGVAALNVAGLPAPVQLLSRAHQAELEKAAGTIAGQVASDVGKVTTAVAVEDQLVSDVNEFASQPPAAPSLAYAPESAATPDPEVTSGAVPAQPPAPPTA